MCLGDGGDLPWPPGACPVGVECGGMLDVPIFGSMGCLSTTQSRVVQEPAPGYFRRLDVTMPCGMRSDALVGEATGLDFLMPAGATYCLGRGCSSPARCGQALGQAQGEQSVVPCGLGLIVALRGASEPFDKLRANGVKALRLAFSPELSQAQDEPGDASMRSHRQPPVARRGKRKRPRGGLKAQRRRSRIDRPVPLRAPLTPTLSPQAGRGSQNRHAHAPGCAPCHTAGGSVSRAGCRCIATASMNHRSAPRRVGAIARRQPGIGIAVQPANAGLVEQRPRGAEREDGLAVAVLVLDELDRVAVAPPALRRPSSPSGSTSASNSTDGRVLQRRVGLDRLAARRSRRGPRRGPTRRGTAPSASSAACMRGDATRRRRRRRPGSRPCACGCRRRRAAPSATARATASPPASAGVCAARAAAARAAPCPGPRPPSRPARRTTLASDATMRSRIAGTVHLAQLEAERARRCAPARPAVWLSKNSVACV